MTYQIAIVGGGLAGLAMAHAPERAKRDGRAQNLMVTVYEQREDESAIQRYPIHLNQDGRIALKGILGHQGYEELVQVAEQGTNHGGITILTPSLSKLLHMEQYRGEKPQFLHRWVLKQTLGRGVNIVHGRRVRAVDQSSDGVKILFDDGTTERADLVVGADGVGSSLRAQLYPDHAIFDRLPYINIQMKLSTPSGALPRGLDTQGINTLLGAHNYSLLLVPFHGHPLPSNSGKSKNKDAEIQDVLKALDQHRPEFLFAILTIRSFNGWETLTADEWQGKTVELLTEDRAHPSLIRMFTDDVIPHTVGQPWQVVSCDPKRHVPYDGGAVVLIGDAAHVMPPQAGAGASNALMDAYRLSETILSATEVCGQGPSILSILPAFHNEMMDRSMSHTKDARRRLYLSNQSGIRVIPQRLVLRTLNLVWKSSEMLRRDESNSTLIPRPSHLTPAPMVPSSIVSGEDHSSDPRASSLTSLSTLVDAYAEVSEGRVAGKA